MGGLRDDTPLQEREIPDELIRADTLFCQRGWAGCKGSVVKQKGLVRSKCSTSRRALHCRVG